MAEETAATEDKRITRSKCALKDALVELIEERGLANFNASDLCSRANLNRGTLYNNFGDKDGLLAALEEDVMRDLEGFQAQMQRLELRDVLRYRISKKPMPFLVSLFDHLREQGSFLHAVMGPKGNPGSAHACATPYAPKSSKPSCTNATATTPRRSCNIRGVLRQRVSGGHHPLGGDGHEGELAGHGANCPATILHQTRRPHQTVRT
ncbi:MAG: TetR/AcrR family transcriptional regulator [Senegalimassilia faecalis]